ncbi:MAG: hypothetical protein HFF18_04190 [Oscillospiraceae bacterium]|nr:hypothetical protein [Oscillospiraceae bacterium]
MMKIELTVAALLLAGAVLAFALLAAWNAFLSHKRSHARREAPREPRQRPRPETAKLVIWVCLINGIAWVWMSYYLAFQEKTQIAEGLSQAAVTEIIGVVLAYCIKSAVENLSKNNRWPDKPGDNENKTVPTALEDPPDVGL